MQLPEAAALRKKRTDKRIISKQSLLAQMWESALCGGALMFLPDPTLPEPAQRYLEHAIAPGTRAASAVWLEMNGEFHLKVRWYPFTAEQVVRRDGEMLWRATIRRGGLYSKGQW